ncbi:MAG: sulfurtransferase TusA family protein [Thermaerobacter sp.]|jgi:tRNA 2-thiouridine synthesizing protein A|nr:sulfurtransferase TusA family protein [Thermaerobacter sp.]
MTADRTLDASGLCCPVPVLKTKAAMETLAVSQVLEVIATDAGARADLAAWCRRTGQTLVQTDETPDGKLQFFIRKTK